jgi:ribosomal protein L11 methylase PrmA
MTPGNLGGRRDPSSFRDDRGFVFWEGGVVYRQVNASGRASYEQLMSSGLYEELTKQGLLVAHEEVKQDALPEGAFAVIRPQLVAFISYPYEWAFSQLKDAALATLAIQKRALAHGMTLRDASAYNMAFVEGRPRLIDTLSFEAYKPGEPWVAYRQFCQHFLAPLALMSRVDLDMLQLMRVHIDGIPLPVANRLLRLKDKLNFGLATHISLHAKFQHQHENAAQKPAAAVGAQAMAGLLDSLERTVRSLRLPKTETQWGDYYNNTNYSDASFQEKGALVGEFLKQVQPKRVLDLGANDGSFSRIAQEQGAFVVSSDIDPLAVESNYLQMKQHQEKRLLPLLVDLTNPSPGLGWANAERSAFTDRARADVALALALIHHLAIANNLPLTMVAEYFAQLAPYLVIEFVPKTDSKVKRLLATREDIFSEYTPAGFEAAFATRFEIVAQRPVAGSERTLYLMKVRG